jgi:hypothetical protein
MSAGRQPGAVRLNIRRDPGSASRGNAVNEFLNAELGRPRTRTNGTRYGSNARSAVRIVNPSSSACDAQTIERVWMMEWPLAQAGHRGAPSDLAMTISRPCDACSTSSDRWGLGLAAVSTA